MYSVSLGVHVPPYYARLVCECSQVQILLRSVLEHDRWETKISGDVVSLVLNDAVRVSELKS